MGRGGGLLVVTLETIRGGAGTRCQWQQHTLDFARMMALPLTAVLPSAVAVHKRSVLEQSGRSIAIRKPRVSKTRVPINIPYFDPNRAHKTAATSADGRGRPPARHERTEITAEDLLLALTHDDTIAPLLADLGVDKAAVRDAIKRRRTPEAPPDPSATG